MIYIFIEIAIFCGVLTQSISGFGLGLVLMPLLIRLVGINAARPLVASIALLTVTSLAIYYKKHFQFKEILPLICASSIGIPLGVFTLPKLDENISLPILGIIILSYALYSLFNFPLPKIKSNKVGSIFALLSGLLSGAYNTGGPPLVIYANCCSWNPEKFKINISSLAFINMILVNINHFIQGNFTTEIGLLILYSIPVIIVGLFVGLSISKLINHNSFRKIVLSLLVIISLQLIYS